MKSFILLASLLILLTNPIEAQQKTDTSQQAFTKEHYLRLSRVQKTQATVFTISGGVMAVVGGYVWLIAPIAGLTGTSEDVKSTRRTGIILTAVGTSLTVLGTHLFNASRKNQVNADLYIGSNRLLYPSSETKDMLCIGARITF